MPHGCNEETAEDKKMRFIGKEDVKLKKRRADSHKGENGKVLVVGGSIDYTGAVLLASLAAYRTGVDWVQVAAPEKVAWVINTFSPDIVTTKVKGEYFTKESADKIAKLSEGFDAVLIGNGIGIRDETKKFAAEIVRKVKKPKVIDADAITAIKLSDVSNGVLTPHPKEMGKLLANSKVDKKSLKQKINGNVILLKGKRDEVISKQKTVFNRTGNAGMTVAGTGDVLAGIAVGILAQEHDLFRSACASAYISGLAGAALYKKKGYGFMASEMLDQIPIILKRLRNG
ncbi:NAD(P)H-hydrate dehydratase [Candidatus Woesearchaeota archaeon]|nr:NAD(P)H-hydrate dehydratase [Candidatus Woesearchaeota archaeon]